MSSIASMLHPLAENGSNGSKADITFMAYVALKRTILVEARAGERDCIRTVDEALRWIDRHVASEPGWTRTRRVLSEAASERSLRKIRAATRAFEEAVKRRYPSAEVH